MLKKITLAFILMSSFCYAEEAIFINEPSRAFQFAQDQKRDVLVIFTADWCKYCQIMHDDMKKNLGDVDNLVVCYVDFDAYPELVEEHKVKTIPDYMYYDHKKTQKARKLGYTGWPSFKEWLRRLKGIKN
jgi:hypothetical protein